MESPSKPGILKLLTMEGDTVLIEEGLWSKLEPPMKVPPLKLKIKKVGDKITETEAEDVLGEM